MRSIKIFLALTLAIASTVITGCSSGGATEPTGSGGSGNAAFETYAYTTAGAWAGAHLNGTAGPGTYACSTSDANCITSYVGIANSGGDFVFSTDALPASWEVGAAADSTCSTGAQAAFTTVTNDGEIELPCGQQATSAVVNCEVIYSSTGTQTSNTCPSTVTLTAASGTFPTSYALDAGVYTIAAAHTSSYSGSASSSSSITITAPVASSTNYGMKILTVWDPNDNHVLATAGFNIEYCYNAGPSSARLYCADPY